MEYIIATYRLKEKENRLSSRANAIAIGLTVGSWTDIPAAKQQEVQKHCGKVEHIEVVQKGDLDSVIAEISIAYPVLNFDGTIASILTTVFGKLSMDGEIRLINLQLPSSLIEMFPGPKFGVAGIRQMLQVKHRPLIMSIFKACIGYRLDELTNQFRDQAMGGVDLVKDDEIFFTESYAAPEDRVRAYTQMAKEIFESTGTLTRYAVHLSGSVSNLLDRARRLVDLGAGALLLNVFAYGYDVLVELASDKDIHVPVMAHPAISGAIYGSPNYGISSHVLLGQLLRLAGADIVIYPSMYGSVTLGKTETQQLRQVLCEKNGMRIPFQAPSAGIYPGLVPKIMKDFGNDVILNAGGGIHGHPMGATAGGKAFVDAVDAVHQGISLQKAAEKSLELAMALEHWGQPE